MQTFVTFFITICLTMLFWLSSVSAAPSPEQIEDETHCQYRSNHRARLKQRRAKRRANRKQRRAKLLS